jgi:hypothetical protein
MRDLPQKIQVMLTPGDDIFKVVTSATVGQVTSNRTSLSGYTMRQGSRSFLSSEK